MAQQGQNPAGQPGVPPMPNAPQLSKQVSFGDWTTMTPEAQQSASAGWQQDRANMANYNQQMFDRYRELDRQASQTAPPDQAIPQNPNLPSYPPSGGGGPPPTPTGPVRGGAYPLMPANRAPGARPGMRPPPRMPASVGTGRPQGPPAGQPAPRPRPERPYHAVQARRR